MDNSASPTEQAAESSASGTDLGTMEKGKKIDAVSGKELRTSKGKTREVTTLDGGEDPKQWSKLRRWFITAIVSISSTCVTFNSSVVSLHDYPSLG